MSELFPPLGDEETRARILVVLGEAVRQGLAHLEGRGLPGPARQGGAEIERGSGFVGMAFRHRMSRAGDPALHVHVVISNLTRAGGDHMEGRMPPTALQVFDLLRLLSAKTTAH